MGAQSAGIIPWLWNGIVSNTVAPSDQGQLTVCYLAWVAVFLCINVAWDIATDKTPDFHLSMMRDKVTVAYDAATFCSSILIISALISPTVRAISKDTTIPLIIAAVSGILRALPALCPYKHEPKKL